MKRVKKVIAGMATTAMVGTTMFFPMANAKVSAAPSNFNYGDALSKSLLFYELQESGELQDGIRTNWRAESGMTAGKDNEVDLTGGWYDAGDNLKLNLPAAYTGTMLSWSYLEDQDTYEKSGQDKYILEQIRRENDYFLKCHTAKDEYYFQVGADNDHAFWGACEIVPLELKSYKATLSQPGSAVCAETAASLASASIVFEKTDPAYSEKCQKNAEELLDLAERMNSDSYYDSICSFYKSYSGFADEISWASCWLYKKTGDKSYLDKAIEWSKKWEVVQGTDDFAYTWTHSWDNTSFGARLLIAELTGDKKFVDSTEKWLDFWSTGTADGERIDYTSNGLAFKNEWGSLRYASTTAFLAYIFAESNICPKDKVDTYKAFAKSQGDYCLGSTGRSFVCGFGTNPPVTPHHRTASGVWVNNVSATVPEVNRHVLIGALVGGPKDVSGAYTDVRTDYQMNEVAVDYNAGYTGLMAKLYKDYGGEIDPNLSAVEEVGQEYVLTAGVNAQDNRNKTDFVEIKASVYNHTAWPARVSTDLKYRYYVDINDVLAQGYTADDVKVTSSYKQNGTTISQLKPVANKKGIYYTEINVSDAKLFPGGQSECRAEAQFRITAPGKWDYTKSPSFKGLENTSGGVVVDAENIPVYEGEKLVYGNEIGDPIPEDPTLVPTVALTAPVDGAKLDVTGDEKSFTISADAAVQNGSVDKVEFYVNDKLVGTAKEAPYSIEYTPTDKVYNEGDTKDYAIKAVATANKDKVTTSKVNTVKVLLPVTKLPPVVEGDLKVTNNVNDSKTSNTLSQNIQIVNNGESLDLSQLSVRYYYTSDGSQSQTVHKDNIAVQLNTAPYYLPCTDDANVSIKDMEAPTETANQYLEVKFDNDTAFTKGGTIIIGTRITKTTWENYDQSNDYSYGDSTHIVVMYGDKVIAGALPQ